MHFNEARPLLFFIHNLVAKHRAVDNMQNMRDCTRKYRQEEHELYVYRTNATSVVVTFFPVLKHS